MIFILGPCAISNQEEFNDIEYVAQEIQNIANRFLCGEFWLRGGCWKPRTHSDSFQGAGIIGLEKMIAAYKTCAKGANPIKGICVEVMSIEQYCYVRNLCDSADIEVMYQVGSRNMQNFELLRYLNRPDNLVFLKRGFGNTVEEFIAARNYMPKAMVYGCERGIRTFSDSSRFTLDLAAILKIHQEANMIPVIVDPSHAAGYALYVGPLALAAIAAGADGLMIETQNTPYSACCDKEQAYPLDKLPTLIEKCLAIKTALELEKVKNL